MKPEYPIIDQAIQADAKRAWGQLTLEQQKILEPFSIEALYLSQQLGPHGVFEALRANHPEAMEALDALQEIP